jgi:hypothetical protein
VRLGQTGWRPAVIHAKRHVVAGAATHRVSAGQDVSGRAWRPCVNCRIVGPAGRASRVYTRAHARAVPLVLGSPDRDRGGSRRPHAVDRLVAGSAAPVEPGAPLLGPFDWYTVIALGIALVAAVVVAIGLPGRKRIPRP